MSLYKIFPSNLSAKNADPLIYLIYVLVSVHIYKYIQIYTCIHMHTFNFLYLQMYLGASMRFFLPFAILFPMHGPQGMLGPQVGKLELLGEGARGHCHHGLRSFSPVWCGAQCLLYRQTTKFDMSLLLFAAVVSSTAWAARLFSVTRTQLSIRILEQLEEITKNAQSWKFWIQMLMCLVPPMQFTSSFSSAGWFEKDPISSHFHGTSWGHVRLEKTARRQLDVNFW